MKNDAPRSRTLAKILLGLGVLAALALASVGPRFPRGGAQASGVEEPSGKGAKVETASPRRGPLVTVVEAPGTVRAGSEVGIGAPFEGTVVALEKDSGDPVKEGDVVFRLDPRDRQEAVQTAALDLARNEAALGETAAERASVERRVAELKEPPSELLQARLRVRQSQLELRRARAQLETSQLELDRNEGMLAEGIGRKLDVDSALSQKRQSEIGVFLAEEALTIAKESLTFQEATWIRDREGAGKDLAVSLAREARADADLRVSRLTHEQRQRELERTIIRSPIDGVVTGRGVNMGDLVVRLSGSETHYLVSDLTHLLVYCDVDEGDVIHVAKGQPARIAVNALGYGRLLQGTIYDVGYRAQTASGEQVSTFVVRILITPGQADLERLRPGMSANATIETARIEGALKVPLQALVQRERKELPEGTKLPAELESKGPTDLVDCVFVVADGKASLRVVQRGLQDDDEAQVLSGLEESEAVVVGPYRTLDTLKAGVEVSARAASELLPPDADPAPVAPVASGS